MKPCYNVHTINQKEMKTSIICVLDRSGSMQNIMNEAVGSFNGFMSEQRKIEGEVEVTLHAFDNRVETIFDGVNLQEISELTVDQVKPRGMTSMYDAIGHAIVTSTAENSIVLIQTDGEENSSKFFTAASIKKMIELKESMGWDFHFIGAGIDAVTAGAKFGVKSDKCMSLGANARGMADMGAYFSTSSTLYRSSKASPDLGFGAK